MNYLFDNYELDTLRFELRLRGEVCRVQPKPLDLLVYLVANRSRVVLKSELLAHLWPGVCVTENALAQAIAALREALSECGPDAVTCIRSRGYRFTRSVVEQGAVVPPPPSSITTRSAPPAVRRLAASLAGSDGFLVDADETSELEKLLAHAVQQGTKVIRASASSTRPLATFRALLQALSSALPTARVAGVPVAAWLDAATDEHAFVAGALSLFRDERLAKCVLVIERLERADIASVLLFGMLAPTRAPGLMLFATCAKAELPREATPVRALGDLASSALEQRNQILGVERLVDARVRHAS